MLAEQCVNRTYMFRFILFENCCVNSTLFTTSLRIGGVACQGKTIIELEM